MKNKKYTFPKQETPSLDLVLIKLEATFGIDHLIVHQAIMDTMEQNKISKEDVPIRKILADMSCNLIKEMSNYEF